MREQGEGRALPLGYGKTANFRIRIPMLITSALAVYARNGVRVSIGGCGSSIPFQCRPQQSALAPPPEFPPQQAPQNVDLSIGPLGCFCKHFVKMLDIYKKSLHTACNGRKDQSRR